jgi:starvation-inducible DNA-binding protein
MPGRGSETSSSGGEREGTTEALLQEELRDLRSLVVHADHLRWVTRGAAAKDLDALVYRFSEDWRRWSESIASCLVKLGVPPDGRVSSLTDGSYRAWLPDDWVETSEADRWILGELGVLAEWAHVRKEAAEPLEVVQLFEDIETGVAQERTELQNWSDAHVQAPDRQEEPLSSSSRETAN